MKWTIEKRNQLSRLYDINWSCLERESKKCSCTKSLDRVGGTKNPCSNPKHMYYVKRERILQSQSVQATNQLSEKLKVELKREGPMEVKNAGKNVAQA